MMVIISIVSLIVSFLLQGFMSNIFNFTISSLSIFSTIYLVVNIVVLKQYFEDDKKFLIIIIIFGLLMDIVYSDTVLFNVFIFIIIFYLNKFLSAFLPYNIMMINLFSLLSVTCYHLITFFFLRILNFDTYTLYVLCKIIACNVIMTIIYTSLLYVILGKLYKRFDLKIIRG